MKTNLIIIDAELLEAEINPKPLSTYDKRRFGRLVRELMKFD